MNFERGKDPKETMEIGAIAEPLVIEDVIYVTKANHPSDDGARMTWSFDFETERSPSHCMRILLGIGNGELNPEGYAVTAGPRMEMVSELLGTYVKYRGELYKIPTYDEIREMRESRPNYELGHIRLH